MNNELYHYGVLGMKWGVRRYQPYGSGGYIPKEKKYYQTTVKFDKKSKAYNVSSEIDKKRKIEGQLTRDQYESIKKESLKLALEDADYYYDHYKNQQLKDIRLKPETKKQINELYKSYMQENIRTLLVKPEYDAGIERIMKARPNYSRQDAEVFYQMTGSTDPDKLGYEVIFNKGGGTTTIPINRKKRKKR